MAQQLPQSEWSHWFDADTMDDGRTKLSIEASEEQRASLKSRLDVQDIKSLTADLTLDKVQGGNTIHIVGTFTADIEQECVVSGDPVHTKLTEGFEAWYADYDSAIPLAKIRQDKIIEKGGREIKMPEEYESPEPFVDGKIDLGELVVQHLSLAINPYPHAEGVVYEKGDDNIQKPVKLKNPFAGLKEWKDKFGGGEGA